MSIPEQTVSDLQTCDFSDHLPVFIKRKNAFTQSNTHNQSVFKSFRNTKEVNVDNLNKVLLYRLSSFSVSQHHEVLFDNLLDLSF